MTTTDTWTADPAFGSLAFLLATTDEDRAAACGVTVAAYQAQLEAGARADELARTELGRERAAHARKCERLNAEADARERAFRASVHSFNRRY